MKEFVCTTTIWIEAKNETEAYRKLEGINRHIHNLGFNAASDPDRVKFEGTEFRVAPRPTIEFDDSDFVAAHGRKPRGDGQWAFRVAGEVWWETGMFAYAKLRIRKRIMAPSTGIHDLGHITVEVLS